MVARSRSTTFIVLLALLVACKSPGTGTQRLGEQAGLVPASVDQPATDQPSDAVPTLTLAPTVMDSGARTAPATATVVPTVKGSSGNSSPATNTPAPAAPSGGEQPVASSAGAPPKIIAFTVSPDPVNPGDTVTLSWQAVGDKAEIGECLISYDHVNQPCSPREYAPVPVTGTHTVAIPREARYSVEFNLVVKSGDGGKADYRTASAQVTCPTKWFFGAAPETDTSCPKDEVVSSQAAWQTFEHGFMMWVASTDLIYVFIDNGKYSGNPDQWESSMPEYDPSIVPPDGFYQPVRGFGLAWRDRKDVLGWAAAPESSFQVVFQCSVYRYHELNCYYQDPNGRIITAEDFFGFWKVVR